MDVTQWIAIIGIIVFNGSALIAFAISINVRIAEINERYISLQKEVTEHKEDNKDTFTDIKNILAETKKDNREDHSKFFEKLDTVSMQVINATNTFITSHKP
jgi:ethanolamine utilization cobalamin adenosyltransferase